MPREKLTSSVGFGVGDLRAPLVGREGAMQRLERALESVAASGEAKAVTILGASGIGKSRLVYDFLVRVRSLPRPPRVFRGSARELSTSYGVFSRLLRARFGLVEGMDKEAARAQVRAQVAKVLDDRKVGDVLYFLGQLLDLEFQESPLTRAIGDDVQQAKLLRGAVFKSFLEADAAHGTLCLVFEDLQFAHQDSLELLRWLVANLRGKVLVVCVARPELLAKFDDWGRGPGEELLELGPLADAEAAIVMEALLEPCGEPPAALVESACALAGGNPALLEQMVRIFHDTGVLEEQSALSDKPVWKVDLDKLASIRLPLTVEDAVAARIAALEPSERTILEHAALVGGVFWLGALVALARADREPPDLWSADARDDAKALEDALESLVDRDYVLRLPDSTFAGDRELVFKHNLEREKLAELTGPAVARSWHRTVADWLEHQSNVRSDEEYAAMLARHREKAGALTRAALTYLDAGDLARSRYASAKAAEYYAKGLELLGEDEVARRIDALHHQGDVLQALGRTDEALAAFRGMQKLAFRLDLCGKGGAAHNRIGRLYREIGRLEDAARHLATGLALFEAVSDQRGIASSLDDLGKLHWLRGDYAEALSVMQASLAMRRRLGDRRSIALSLNNLGLALQDSGQTKEALEAFEQALAIRREIGDLIGVATTLNNLGTIAQDQREDERALALFQQAYDVAKEVGDRFRMALVLTNIGETQYRLGDAAEAIRLLTQAEAQFDRIGDRLGLAEALRGLGKAYLLQRDLVRAREHIARAVELFAEVKSQVNLGIGLRSLGEVTAAGGWGREHADKAREYFARSTTIFEETGNEIELARTLRSYAAFLRQYAETTGDVAATADADAMEQRAEAIFVKLRIPWRL